MRTVESNAYLIDFSLVEEERSEAAAYPFSIPAISKLGRVELHPGVTFFIGENGTGKSTLLEAIAISVGLNPEGGSRNFRFGTRDSHSELNKSLRVAKGVRRPKDSFFLRAESLYNVGTEIEALDSDPRGGPPVVDSFGGVSLHEQSHGESFIAVMSERFFGNGLYLLDEPEAALSPTRQLACLKLINRLVKQDSQFLICTHSPIIMAYPDAWIYQLSADGIERVDYKESDHYAVTKEFLTRPERMLDLLFEDD